MNFRCGLITTTWCLILISIPIDTHNGFTSGCQVLGALYVVQALHKLCCWNPRCFGRDAISTQHCQLRKTTLPLQPRDEAVTALSWPAVAKSWNSSMLLQLRFEMVAILTLWFSTFDRQGAMYLAETLCNTLCLSSWSLTVPLSVCSPWACRTQ